MGGAPVLPTASTPGFGTFHGKVGCNCVIEFLTAAEQLGLARGLIKQGLDVVQLSGNAPASAGVHLPGSCFDVKQFTPDWVRLFREMGAAFFPRTGPDWVGNEHGHGGITCPHDENSAYQMVAYKRGYNGLGKPTTGPYASQWGYGGKDTFWRPAVFRTRAQGIAWAQAEIARLEDSMPTPKELWDYKMASPTDKTYVTTAQSWLTNANVKAGEARALASRALAEVAALTAAFKALAAQPDLTPEQVTAAAKAGAQAALDEKITGAVTNLTVGP